MVRKGDNNFEPEVQLDLESKDNKTDQVEEPGSLISFETIESPLQMEIIRQPCPPPVLAEMQDLIPSTSPVVTDEDCELRFSSADGLVCAEAPLELHISTALMDSFMRLAKSNTDKNLETCGVLLCSLKNWRFSVPALIIPKQELTSNLTHPTKSCSMSSIDVHAQYSYQVSFFLKLQNDSYVVPYLFFLVIFLVPG